MFEPKRYHIETRSEFERNLNMLVEGMRQGRVHFVRGMEGFEHFKSNILKVRALPNKRFDFSTVSESVRNIANSMSHYSQNADIGDEKE